MYSFSKNKFIKISQSNLFPVTNLLSDLLVEARFADWREDANSQVKK